MSTQEETKNETEPTSTLPCGRCLVKKPDTEYDTKRGRQLSTCRKCLAHIRHYKANVKLAHADDIVTCVCGATVLKRNLTSHKRTRRHLQIILGVKDSEDHGEGDGVKKQPPANVTKYTCGCGSYILMASRYNHTYSKKHRFWKAQVSASIEDVELAKDRTVSCESV